jgi:hypothetical protein
MGFSSKSGSDDQSGRQGALVVDATIDERTSATAVVFDVGFLDGIQVESPNFDIGGRADESVLAKNSRSLQQAAASEVAKRLKANADRPLPLNTSRQRKSSKLGKA